MNEKLVIASIFAAFVVLEILNGKFRQKSKSSKKDVLIEVLSSVTIILITVPLILHFSSLLGRWLLPEYQGALSDLSWPVMFLLFLLFDDLVQYWWHRACHSPLLYGLHRAHHSANYMSIRVVYRNNLFYYMIMPNLWLTGFLVYLGLFKVYPYYLVIKMTIIFGAHSSLPWDKWLHQQSWLSPVSWVIERLISTPSTHHAHHGMHAEDGITHYKGNYGNMLFLWDVIFGTAHITRKYPPEYGIEHLENSDWKQELLWPLVNNVPNSLSEEVNSNG